MWKTIDGYTLTMPQSELEALAAMYPGGCGCKECGIKAVAQELDRYISSSRLLRRSSGRAHSPARARGGRHARAAMAQRAPGSGTSATFGGGSGSSSYQFRTRPLPGNRRLIYAYTPPPWARPYPYPPPPPPQCAPDDPSCAPPADAAPDPDPASGDAPPDGDAGELGGTLLDALVRGR